MKELQDMWKQVQNKMEMMVSVASYDIWIAPLEVLDYNKFEKLILATNTEYAKKQILQNLSRQLQIAIDEVFGENTPFEVLSPEEKKEFLKKNKPEINQAIAEKECEEEAEFNPKYTFDNFVVGKSNQYVYAAAHSVAENPGKRFNPLFIYGGSGLGKTHLMHAIGQEILRLDPKKKIIYVTSAEFTYELVNSMLSNSTAEKKAIKTKWTGKRVLPA